MSESARQHKHHAKKLGAIPVAIVTVSDTRTRESDVNRPYLEKQLTAAGHHVAAYRLIPDEPAEVERTLRELSDGSVKVQIWNGGTGISGRDRTYDVLARHLEKTLPGFGELFRMFSYEEVGAAAMLSRAVAGVCRGQVIISTPGSPAAVRLAWEKLIAPEIEHLAWEVSR